MQTRLSTKGQLVLPGPVRRRLGLRPGDSLQIEVEDQRIVLTPAPSSSRGKARIIKDPVTGMPVLTRGPGSPVMTSREVEELLAEFP